MPPTLWTSSHTSKQNVNAGSKALDKKLGKIQNFHPAANPDISMFVFIPHWNKDLKCHFFFSGWKFWGKNHKLFSAEVKTFCPTFSNISTFLEFFFFFYFGGVFQMLCFKSLQCSNCAFPLCYSLLGYGVWKFALCILCAWIVWVVSCLKTLKTCTHIHPCTRQKRETSVLHCRITVSHLLRKCPELSPCTVTGK